MRGNIGSDTHAARGDTHVRFSKIFVLFSLAPRCSPSCSMLLAEQFVCTPCVQFYIFISDGRRWPRTTENWPICTRERTAGTSHNSKGPTNCSLEHQRVHCTLCTAFAHTHTNIALSWNYSHEWRPQRTGSLIATVVEKCSLAPFALRTLSKQPCSGGELANSTPFNFHSNESQQHWPCAAQR